MSLSDTWRRLTARTGELFTSDGSRFNEADYLSRVNAAMSSFGELSVASHRSLIDLKSVYPLSSQRDKVIGTSGGTVTQGDGMFSVTTPADGAAEVVFRSLERGRYIAGFDAIPGLGIESPTRPTGNQEIEWGYTDFTEGFTVGEDANGFFMRVYSGGSVVDEVRREDWYDPLDSGNFVLDPTELNIYRFPFRWYKRGPVTLDLACEDVNGFGRVCKANAMRPKGFIKNPNQPLSVRIRNNGTATAMEVRVAGRQYFINGDYNPIQRITAESRLAQSVGDTAFVPLVSFRQKGGVYESITARLSEINIISDGNLIFQMRVDTDIGATPTFNPPSFSDSGTETAMEFNTTATAVTGGLKIYEGLVSGGQGNSSQAMQANLPDTAMPYDGRIVTLCAKSVAGTSTVSSTSKVREEW